MKNVEYKVHLKYLTMFVNVKDSWLPFFTISSHHTNSRYNSTWRFKYFLSCYSIYLIWSDHAFVQKWWFSINDSEINTPSHRGFKLFITMICLFAYLLRFNLLSLVNIFPLMSVGWLTVVYVFVNTSKSNYLGVLFIWYIDYPQLRRNYI